LVAENDLQLIFFDQSCFATSHFMEVAFAETSSLFVGDEILPQSVGTQVTEAFVLADSSFGGK
jgi:hypothetical protein